jgi:hypothetical protein
MTLSPIFALAALVLGCCVFAAVIAYILRRIE